MQLLSEAADVSYAVTRTVFFVGNYCYYYYETAVCSDLAKLC